VKAVYVQPYNTAERARDVSCMQLTDRRVYFTWKNARHWGVEVFRDEESFLELSPPTTPPADEAMPYDRGRRPTVFYSLMRDAMTG
jgi:hypothetical protein